MIEVKYYFYNNIDEAFYHAIQDVRNFPEKGSEVFARVLYAQYKDNVEKKICIVYNNKSDDVGFEFKDDYRLVYSVDMSIIRVIRQSVITKQQIYDGEIDVEPLNEYYQGKRVFSNFVNISSYKDCDSKECVSDYKKCDNKKFEFVDDANIYSEPEQQPLTNMFCRRISSDDLVLELNKLDDLDDFRRFIVNVYYDMPNFKEVIREVLEKASDQTRRNFYLLKGVPEFKTEKASSEGVEEDLQNYINDVDLFYELMEKYKYTIAGGFILKNFIRDKPKYKENRWEDNDIDIWALRDIESDIYDPFDPLKQLLYKEGYNLKKVCGNRTLKNFEGDYRRLHEYIEQIQEWTKTAYGVDYKIQLILLKDKNANLKSIRRRISYRYDLDEEYVRLNGLKYELRTYDDYINDLVLSFDLLCCQCAFNIKSGGKKEITFYGNVADYEEDEPTIVQTILNYETKFSKLCQEKQSLWEWCRSLLRAIKYGKRGFKIINWGEVIDTIKPLFSENPSEDFLNEWNNIIGDNIFYRAVGDIPIFQIQNDELFMFTVNNREMMFVTDENIADISPFRNIKRIYNLTPISELQDSDINMDKLSDIVGVNFIDSFFDPVDSEYPTIKQSNALRKDEDLIDEDNTNVMLKQCFNSLDSEYKDVSDVLSRDEDNIVLVSKYGSSYNIECMNRKMFYKVLGDNTKARYTCLETNKDTGRPIREVGLVMRGWYDSSKVYYRVDANFGNYYFEERDILELMMSKEQIFYVVKDREVERGVAKSVIDNEEKMYANEDYEEDYLVSAHHCQEGSSFTVAKIKVSNKEILERVRTFVNEYLQGRELDNLSVGEVRRAYEQRYDTVPPKMILRNSIQEYVESIRG